MEKKQYYPQATGNPDFPKIEEEVLKFWREEGAFEKSVENRPSNKDGKDNEFVFYDGPPFANGLPHYGHLLTGFVKDIFARYQTIKGKKVERRFGWDCHGLPAEMGAEKELGISGRHKIVEYGIENFNNQCRTSVMKFSGEWEKYVARQARWVDFSNSYKTMDTNYMESVLWAFKQLYDKGLVYESMRVMPYSWACETPLSNFETRMDNSYRERADKAVTVAFTLNERPEGAPEADEYKLLAWTTTPWTLPSNLALAVGENIEYACVVVEQDGASGELPLPWGEGRGEGAKNVNKARELRQNSTEVEKKLWSELRGRRFENYKFRRQMPLGDYIADFVCWDRALIIELDGGQHAEQKEYDKKRTEYLEGLGFKVVRFWNNDVTQNLEGVLETIAKELADSSRPLTLTLSPRERELPVARTVCYILAKSSLPSYAKEFGASKIQLGSAGLLIDSPMDVIDSLEYAIENPIKGSVLIGLTYQSLFPYFSSHANSFKILSGDFVTEGDGTGTVHLAPGFGEDDQRVCEAAGIKLVCPVDNAGKFTAEIYDLGEDGATSPPLPWGEGRGEGAKLSLQGRNVLETNDDIIKYLKAQGSWIKTEQYLHNYPHCWRTDTPLIYKAVPSWYVEVTKFKDRMVELNQQINWIPNHIKDGQFGKWLENARDWSISRNRFWGAPIPIWRSDNPQNKNLYVFGSIKELEEFFEVKVEDLHRPFIDTLTKPDPQDPKYTLRRVEDVFDCWFESGSMPYAQAHYPFENKDWFECHFPADFIVEYVAQTRGWFYTLMVLSTALFDRPPFLNVICHGVVLGEPVKNPNTGKMETQKLSKRLKNYPEPMDIFDQYGADAMRWVMISAPIMHGGEMIIDKEGNMVRDAVRLILKPIWNSYSFFALYANADGIEARYHPSSDNLMDRYILAKCKDAVQKIEAAMDAYDTPLACRQIENFFEVLNNWYIRRNKERFWRTEHDGDKFFAYNTLYSILHIMARAASPLLPLLSEKIWQGINGGGSVHLADFPDVSKIEDEAHLVHDMDRVRDACNAALSIRNAENARVRQPLASLTIVDPESERLADYADLIKDEVNVKEVKFSGDVAAKADLKLKVNFPVLGKRLPEKMKDIIAATKQGNWKLVGGQVEVVGELLTNEECTLQLEPKDKKGAQALSSNDALVILDLYVTPELKIEGVARDLVRFIQQSRKDADLQITDRIALNIETANDDVMAALDSFGSYIAEQTLASSLDLGKADSAAHRFEQKIEGGDVVIGFKVA
jgi:isoleucyl-tRNA synthetase